MAMTKEKTISIAGTVLIHALLLLCLLYFYVKPVDKDLYNDELGGVPIVFGNVSDAFGIDDPSGNNSGYEQDIDEDIEFDPTLPNYVNNQLAQSEVKQTANTMPAEIKETTLAAIQDVEKTVSATDKSKQEQKKKKEQELAEQKKKAEADKKKKEAEAAQKKKSEADQKAKEEAEKKKNINSQMAGLFGNGSTSGSKGNTTSSGAQGSPSGNSNAGKLSGVAGLGSYDLGGRGVGANGLVLPAYKVDDYGTVVVDIIVDPQGNVIEPSIGKGTTTANSSLLNESLSAAKRTKFRSIPTSNNQRGTITYKFNLK